MGWEEFFDIYPFTQDREDARVAALRMTITNMSGRQIKDFTDIFEFLPSYTDQDKKQLQEKSVEQQIADDIAFADKLRSITGK